MFTLPGERARLVASGLGVRYFLLYFDLAISFWFSASDYSTFLKDSAVEYNSDRVAGSFPWWCFQKSVPTLNPVIRKFFKVSSEAPFTPMDS